jgi:hypothetical protein
MPIYEFYCPDNHRIYSFFARSLAYADRTPRCPDGATFRMERMISKFAITGRAKEKKDAPPDADLDDPKMDAMMAEMEREFSGMDSENPDPKMLARMMRKMTSMTGEKMPGEVDEMIRRMEAGEDPDALEAEFGDALDKFDPMGGKEGEAGEGENMKARLRALRQPRRDPTLYEMSEYLDEKATASAPTGAKKKRQR